ncbi:DUF397 domain-containing protein [Nocardiopsis synnemataformans]|uniref:DUF397 domain-containing protein n=1 Tax=Nocardiopsis synnemataformans TaxID=61305 RepID=UPI003EBDC88A
MPLCEWRKSSYSAGQSACVEVARVPTAFFRKSSHSANAQACVEVADTLALHAVRDSKTPEQAPLMFDRTEWHAFIRGTKDTRR